MRRNPYGFTVESELGVEEAEAKVRGLLKEEGLSILTDIDVRKTFETKLGIDFREYRILGACDPSLAHAALEIEPSVGLILPCNVVLDSRPGDGSAVSFLDPMVALAMVGNPALRETAADAWGRLMRVARRLTRRRASQESEAGLLVSPGIS